MLASCLLIRTGLGLLGAVDPHVGLDGADDVGVGVSDAGDNDVTFGDRAPFSGGFGCRRPLCSRPVGDHVMARLGGDEFVLILENTRLDVAETVARRIQGQVAAWAKEKGLDFSVSIGLGEASTHGTSFAEVLEQVDKAMYDGKAECGRS